MGVTVFWFHDREQDHCLVPFGNVCPAISPIRHQAMAGRQVNFLLMICSSEGRSLPEGNFPYRVDIGFRVGAGLELPRSICKGAGSIWQRPVVLALPSCSSSPLRLLLFWR